MFNLKCKFKLNNVNLNEINIKINQVIKLLLNIFKLAFYRTNKKLNKL